MKRPWRLTRRERVEVESALGSLRRGENASTWVERLFPGCSYEAAFDELLGGDGWRTRVRATERVLRARVAIALRAALRADEDARAEEAYVRAYEKSFSMRNYGLAESAHAGAWWAIAAMRGWPIERRDDGLVPLALWEAAWRPTAAQQPSEGPAPTDETP